MKHFPTLLELRKSRREPFEAEYLMDLSFANGVRTLVNFKDQENIDVDFYSQPLALWMFVPCGEDGEPMEKPDHYEDWINDVGRARSFAEIISLQDYEDAEKRVLFEGWGVVDDNQIKREGIYLTFHKGYIAIEGGISYALRLESTLDQLLNFFSTRDPQTPTQSALTQLNIKK